MKARARLLIALVALVALPSVVNAGPNGAKKAKSFHPPSEYSKTDWTSQQTFGDISPGDSDGRSLVGRVFEMARLVPAQQLLQHLERLSFVTLRNVLHAFDLSTRRASRARISPCATLSLPPAASSTLPVYHRVSQLKSNLTKFQY